MVNTKFFKVKSTYGKSDCIDAVLKEVNEFISTYGITKDSIIEYTTKIGSEQLEYDILYECEVTLSWFE